MRLDEGLRVRCVSAGLDPAEMLRLYTESGSIGPVLSRIGAAESELLCRQRDEADRREQEADRGSVGVGSASWRTGTGRSFTLSVRLDHDEIAELRRLASEQNLLVSVLARRYIRRGLARSSAGALPAESAHSRG